MLLIPLYRGGLSESNLTFRLLTIWKGFFLLNGISKIIHSGGNNNGKNEWNCGTEEDFD